MISFFIDRPIFAWVLAIIVMLVGVIAVMILPIAQYPPVAPPTITVTAVYPGASAQTVASTVVQVIEQQLGGLDNLLYFASKSDKSGAATITLSFSQGTDPDVAQVQVQNRLQLATPRLPAIVQQQGIVVAKATKDFLMVLGFTSDDSNITSFDLSDFIASHIQDPLGRTPGVGGVALFGAEYAMRIWLDPAKLVNYGLMPSDVVVAIQAQNVQLAAGELGGLPAVEGQELNATIVGPSYLSTAEEFGNILLKVTQTGAQVRLHDVARVELGPSSFSPVGQFSGHPASAIAVNLAAGANALATVTAVRHTMAVLEPSFPPGVHVIYPYDTSPFVILSIHEVVETLVIAVVLVFLIMLLFLQNLRATLVPTIAVPVVLLGTCGVLAVAHYSLNRLTLFGMVLAIGLLVDDAIVVVENVQRVMREERVSPREAARRSMTQISGALIGIALVLTAVLLPIAFFGGSTGVIYRQFSITIVSAMILSVIVALIFSPALCATLLKPEPETERRGFFGLFNRGFDRTTRAYGRGVGGLVRRPIPVMIVFAAIVAGLAFLYVQLPISFLPDEDQGVLFVQVTAPPGATGARTRAVLNQVEHYFLTEESKNVDGVFTVNGLSFAGNGQNAGLGFVQLKSWDERQGAANHVGAIAGRAMRFFATIKDASVFAFAPPAILDLGNATGFDLQLVDNASLGREALLKARDELLQMAAKDPVFAGVRANGLDDEPQYKIVIDNEKASALGASLTNVYLTMQIAWGSSYVGDFVNHGRVKRIFMQGEAASRMLPDELMSWFVRGTSSNSANPNMVPLSALSKGVWGYGSPQVLRYNGVPAIEILGQPGPGHSTGEAMKEIEQLATKLPAGIGLSWTGLSYEEVQSGSNSTYAYALALIVVFLSLAALYESWSIPIAVLLVVPLGAIGAVVATWMRGLADDIYFQVGLLVIVGLSAKNAILIVEFAKQGFEEGKTAAVAALEASVQRLRPILMTSLAFILGVLPLAIATGAGSGSENAIGTGVVGGMLGATFLAIFFVPVFFVLVIRLFRGETHDDTAAIVAALTSGEED